MGNVRLVSPQAYDIRVVFVVVPLTPVNTRTVGMIETQAGIPAVAMQLVPGNEVWHIEDIFTLTAETGIGRIELMVNSSPQPFTPDQRVIDIVDPTRLKLPRSVMVPQAGNITCNFVNLVANGATTSDLAVHLKCMRYPVQ